jgi:hypothetical protein
MVEQTPAQYIAKKIFQEALAVAGTDEAGLPNSQGDKIKIMEWYLKQLMGPDGLTAIAQVLVQFVGEMGTNQTQTIDGKLLEIGERDGKLSVTAAGVQAEVQKVFTTYLNSFRDPQG